MNSCLECFERIFFIDRDDFRCQYGTVVHAFVGDEVHHDASVVDLAAMGIGDITATDIPGLVRIRRVFEPQPQTRAVYAQGYDGFKAAYRALSPFYRRLSWETPS